MKLYAPKYYNEFKCIADKCTHSCCVGWEIDMILIMFDFLVNYLILKNNSYKIIIDEFDVVANHGASIGKMSDDSLFYLMSRGLTKEEASKIIIMGFINPLVDKIEDKETKEMLINSFLEKSSLK